MTNKLEISRELLTGILAFADEHWYGFPGDEELRALLAKADDADKVNNRQMGLMQFVEKHAAPVVERQPAQLLVWEGAMPESNGKSNFTVILHTGDLTEGICVYRSEYPDRARYEADCFRHLIGDPAFPEKPFVCDYDADKHSGYVKPDTSQPAPVAVVPEGWKIVPIEPTEYMMKVARGLTLQQEQTPSAEYRAMVKAAPACLDKVKELNQ